MYVDRHLVAQHSCSLSELLFVLAGIATQERFAHLLEDQLRVCVQSQSHWEGKLRPSLDLWLGSPSSALWPDAEMWKP